MSDEEKPTRCVISGCSIVVPSEQWREARLDPHVRHTQLCIGCGHEVRYRVREDSAPFEARMTPHRTDGTPCR